MAAGICRVSATAIVVVIVIAIAIVVVIVIAISIEDTFLPGWRILAGNMKLGATGEWSHKKKISEWPQKKLLLLELLVMLIASYTNR